MLASSHDWSHKPMKRWKEEKTDSTELHSEFHIHNMAQAPIHHTHSTIMTIINNKKK